MAPHPDKEGDPIARHSLSPAELKELLAAERKGQPFLVFRDDKDKLCLFQAGSESRTVTLGRRPGMDISISWDAEVSSLHAELEGFVDEWTIVDDGLSTNGTYVNGERIGG